VIGLSFSERSEWLSRESVEQGVNRMKELLLSSVLVGMVFGTVTLPVVTYYRDVLPILQKHCLACHRPGQIAPISFLSYERTRPLGRCHQTRCADS
jgi:hypothetical protein